MMRLIMAVSLACGTARGRLAEDVMDLDPDALRKQVGLIGNGGASALFVDLSQWALYRPVFDHLRAGGLPKVRLARLNCAEFYTFCEDELLVQPWDCLRLYLPGSRVSATGHAAFPLSLLARGKDEELDEPFGFEYLKEFIASEGLASAQGLAKSWVDKVLASEPASSPGLVQVTDDNLEHVMQMALAEPSGQVLMLYHGSYLDCAEQLGAAKGAHAQLGKLGDWVWSHVTIGLVNCDIYHKPCEMASLAEYCHANHFHKHNACPNSIGGPRGNALYGGEWTADSIAFTLKSRLPENPARLSMMDKEEL